MGFLWLGPSLASTRRTVVDVLVGRWPAVGEVMTLLQGKMDDEIARV